MSTWHLLALLTHKLGQWYIQFAKVKNSGGFISTPDTVPIFLYILSVLVEASLGRTQKREYTRAGGEHPRL